MRHADPDVPPQEAEEGFPLLEEERSEEMSIFAEYKHGQVDYDEFMSVCRWEEAKDRYYEEHQFDEKPAEENEEGDEENEQD